MSDPTYPSVTVVLVVSGVVLQENPSEADLMNPILSDAARTSIYSAEQQQYPGECHLNLVQNVENNPVQALRAVGVQYATTEWVALMEEGDDWAPDMLTRLVEDAAPEPTTGSHMVSQWGHTTTLVRRDAYLEQNGL